MLVDFPFQAIRAASKLGEYTLTDYGTWCAIEQDVRDKLAIFVSTTERFYDLEAKKKFLGSRQRR